MTFGRFYTYSISFCLVVLASGCTRSEDFDAKYKPPLPKKWETYYHEHRDEVLGKVEYQRFFEEISLQELQKILATLLDAFEKESDFKVEVKSVGGTTSRCRLPYPLYFISGQFLHDPESGTDNLINVDPPRVSSVHKHGLLLRDEQFIETLRSLNEATRSTTKDVKMESRDPSSQQTFTISRDLIRSGKIYFECNADSVPLKGGHRHSDNDFGFKIRFVPNGKANLSR